MRDNQETGGAGMKPVALLVAAHPIWNVPPFVNAAQELARQGYSVLVLGYQADDLPRYERLGSGAWILRLRLVSRRIRSPGVRKLLALLEFLYLARATTMRLRPNLLVTFNDPACILQRIVRTPENRRCVNWLLEYPEFERLSFLQRQLFRWSASCWKNADTLVAPTRERLALHLALRPECAHQRSFVVQNAPRNEPEPPEPFSPETEMALRFLADSPPGNLRLVYSGAIGNRYAVDRLIRAAGSFRRDVRLLLLGAKHRLAEREVDVALKEIGFPENIRWIDEVPYPELSLVLSRCDAGFATYLGDTLNTRFSAPDKVYEYLKSGLIIVSDEECCIYPEASTVGCGMFFPRPVTDHGIQSALRQLLDDREKREKMKAASRGLFESRLCMEKQMTPLIEELQRAPLGADKVSFEEEMRRHSATTRPSFSVGRR